MVGGERAACPGGRASRLHLKSLLQWITAAIAVKVGCGLSFIDVPVAGWERFTNSMGAQSQPKFQTD